MNTIARTSLIFCLFALSFNLPAADQAPVTSFLNKTATSITGYDVGLKISFSSQWVDDGKTVLVDIQLENKRITSRFDQIDDPNKRAFSLKVVNEKTGKVTNLTAKELGDLMVLKGIVGHTGTTAHRFLAKTFELVLTSDPDGEDIDWSTQKFKEELEKAKDKTLINTITPQGFTSLCLNLGQTMTGRYTIKEKGKEVLKEEQVVIGPCYSGECLGRCGPLCTGEQSYTQECLNHDLCAGATGKNHGPCHDEFRAAADGYVFAPDCAKMNGQWTDNFAFRWNFAPETTGGSITGTVAAGSCGTWNVTGNRATQDITLTATNPVSPPQIGCCTTFTYTGTAQCNSASGNWTNACTLNGSWNMQRDGAAVTGATVLPLQSGPSPATSQ